MSEFNPVVAWYNDTLGHEKFTLAETEVIARRYLMSLGVPGLGVDFEEAVCKVMDMLAIVERCGGTLTFDPPLNPASGSVYGEEVEIA